MYFNTQRSSKVSMDGNMFEEDDLADDGSAEFEKEPTHKDIPQQDAADSEDLRKKQVELQKLLDQKDKLLMQYRSGQLSTDKYKEAIGNIPQQIKKLKDQIEPDMGMPVDDTEEDMA